MKLKWIKLCSLPLFMISAGLVSASVTVNQNINTSAANKRRVYQPPELMPPTTPHVWGGTEWYSYEGSDGSGKYGAYNYCTNDDGTQTDNPLLANIQISHLSFGMHFDIANFTSWVIDPDLGYNQYFSFGKLFNHYIVENPSYDFQMKAQTHYESPGIYCSNDEKWNDQPWMDYNIDHSLIVNDQGVEQQALKNNWTTQDWNKPICGTVNYPFWYMLNSIDTNCTVTADPEFDGGENNLFNYLELCIYPNQDNPSVPLISSRFNFSQHKPLPPGVQPNVQLKAKFNFSSVVYGAGWKDFDPIAVPLFSVNSVGAINVQNFINQDYIVE